MNLVDKLTLALRAGLVLGDATANRWRGKRLASRAKKLRRDVEALEREGEAHARDVDSMNRKHRKLISDYEATK